MWMLHARNYVERAERLIDEAESLTVDTSKDDWMDVLRRRPQLIQYAALELRLGIETAAYKILQSRRKNFNRSMFSDWRANKIVEFVSDVLDENFDADSVMSFCETGKEKDLGAWKLVGHTKGVKKRDANRFYNALGQLLHIHDDSESTPQFPQFPRVAKEEKAIAKVREVIEYMKSFDGHMDAHFDQVLNHVCECGEHISRPIQVLRKYNLVECPNSECANEWRVVAEEGKAVWKDALDRAPCPSCGFGIIVRNEDYAFFRDEISKSRKIFRAGNDLSKNMMCLNPECSNSIELYLTYQYRNKQ